MSAGIIKQAVKKIKQNEIFEQKLINPLSLKLPEGEYYSEISSITFYYDEEEGSVWTDYLANDKGWFIVSERFKSLLQKMNSDIQFIDVSIYNIKGVNTEKKYCRMHHLFLLCYIRKEHLKLVPYQV